MWTRNWGIEMIYRTLAGEKVALLGMGTMRLPTMADGHIDEAQVFSMVDDAIAAGVNYFDTAYPYQNGESETVIGKALARYPRESWFLADKYPGHQIAERYDPAEIFEEQLRKCGVDYFDFYLLHNVYEKSLDVYTDAKWGIVPYLVEQKRRGRIKHLGFSTHGRPDCIEKLLDYCGDEMEFCQIQLNFLDWTLQNAREKYEMLSACHIPVIVMEPVRGGRLCDLGAANETLRTLRPDESIPAWSFRFLQDLPGVSVILSGMSNTAQMRDNLKTFASEKPLSDSERDLLFSVAEKMKNALPCTACRYCVSACPQGLDIPTLLHGYNDAHFSLAGALTAAMQLDALPKDKQPSACIGCGACARMCPQNIDIPAAMREFAELHKTSLPNWETICRERAAIAEKNRKK